MEPFLDEEIEEIEYRARREKRRQRMLREKRRRRVKKLLAGFLCIGLAGVFLVSRGKPEKEKEEQEAQQEEPVIERQLEENWENVSQVKAQEEAQPKVYSFEKTQETVSIENENVISTNAVLVDMDTDTIVASKGETERISPASMTKVLTILVAAEELSAEDLEDYFDMTLEITDYSYVHDCSNVGFLDGERIKVKDLFYGTILPSGGDAAVGLATYTAGSHEAFVELMNEKLASLGLSGSAHVTNCVGLYDEDHYCTVYDMAVIMRAALDNELCREVLAEKCYTTAPTAEHPEGLTISNWFLRRIEDQDTGGEVKGAKTGFVNQSGSCAVSYQVDTDGEEYICVTAGSSSSWRCIYDHVEIYTRYAVK